MMKRYERNSNESEKEITRLQRVRSGERAEFNETVDRLEGLVSEAIASKDQYRDSYDRLIQDQEEKSKTVATLKLEYK